MTTSYQNCAHTGHNLGHTGNQIKIGTPNSIPGCVLWRKFWPGFWNLKAKSYLASTHARHTYTCFLSAFVSPDWHSVFPILSEAPKYKPAHSWGASSFRVCHVVAAIWKILEKAEIWVTCPIAPIAARTLLTRLHAARTWCKVCTARKTFMNHFCLRFTFSVTSGKWNAAWITTVGLPGACY